MLKKKIGILNRNAREQQINEGWIKRRGKKRRAFESDKLNFRYACLIISHGCATVWIRLNYTAASNPRQTEYPLIELPGTLNSESRKVRLPLKPRARFRPPEFEKHKRGLSSVSLSPPLFPPPPLSLTSLSSLSRKSRYSLVSLMD